MATPACCPVEVDDVPRRPQETVLYAIVREHLATFVQHAAQSYATPLPKYVLDTFEHYLACGDLSRGFLRCHCDACGHDVLVAFSCKCRAVCPICATRRMCNEAANLVDRIVPNVPIRQWVLSVPWELRGLAATNRQVLAAMDRIFGEEIGRVTKRLANVANAETGSIGLPQIFGGSLNVHPHLHTLAVEGVFEKTDSGIRFHETKPPSMEDVAQVAKRVRDRFVRWLGRHGFVDQRAAEDRSDEPASIPAIEGCQQLALAGGTFLAKPSEAKDDANADLDRRERRFSARCDGFDVPCAVRIEANDDIGRERLVRYCARPSLSVARIEVLKDGRIAYRVKNPRRGRGAAFCVNSSTEASDDPTPRRVLLALLVSTSGDAEGKDRSRRRVLRGEVRCFPEGRRRREAGNGVDVAIRERAIVIPRSEGPRGTDGIRHGAGRNDRTAPRHPCDALRRPGRDRDLRRALEPHRTGRAAREGHLRRLGRADETNLGVRRVAVPALRRAILEHLKLPTKPPPRAPPGRPPWDQQRFDVDVA